MADIVGVLIEESYFQEAKKAKKVYKNDFVPALKEFKNIRKALDEEKLFKGKSRDELLGLLEILEEYYGDLVDAFDGYYDTFEGLRKGLAEVERQETFKNVHKK